jgi:hypothetical protein
MTSIPELVVIMLGVILLTIQAFVINRLSGIAYPVWSGKDKRNGGIAASALELDVAESKSDTYRSIADQITSRKK